MNDLMSFGVHRAWKNYYVKKLPLNFEDHVLDLAGGTGDISKRIHELSPFLNIQMTVCDLTFNMLENGRDRFIDLGILQNQNWVCGNGEFLPFPDASFDGVTISFGLRNVTHIDKTLSEIFRVLKPNGWLHCLEFSQIENPIFKKIYDIYSFEIIPLIGEKVANDRDAYQYLIESIRKFPSQSELVTYFESAGFKDCSYENLTNGVVAIHRGRKV
jgi:ubiquinone/menaquinone biosynthesis methyltransferase